MTHALTDTAAASLGDLDTLIGYHLRRCSGVMSAPFARGVAGTGLRQVPFAILSVIAENPGIRQGAAGETLGIQRANMVALINELIEAGYVDRRPAEDDRRAFALYATTEGAEVLRRCTRSITEQETRVLAEFTAAERGTLLKLLRRIEARERG